MDKNSAGFIYLKNKFPWLFNTKIKEGVFVGPKIIELMQNLKSEYQVTEADKAAWKSFINLTTIF
jgi:hypothetical protein